MQSTWECIISCNLSTDLGLMKGSYLWTVWLSTPSDQNSMKQTDIWHRFLFLSGDHQLSERQAAASETHSGLSLSALAFLKVASSPHCSSPYTQMTGHLKTLQSGLWIMQTAPLSSALSRMVMSLLTDRGLYSWLSGSHYNLKLNTLKTVELIVDIMRNSPALPTKPWTALWQQWSHSGSWAKSVALPMFNTNIAIFSCYHTLWE